MNQREKLVENTILALQGKLTEDVETNDINKYYRDFGNKVRGIVQQLTHDTERLDSRTKNIMTIVIDQRYLIDRKDCQNYIQKQAKIPLTHNVDYEKDKGKYILNKEFEKAVDYVENKYIPILKEYMDSHNEQCINLIQKTFKDNNIIIKDIENNVEMSEQYQEYKYMYIRNIIDSILRGWENPYELYPYQHIYTLTIDINDNKNINIEDNYRYKVSFNPNYSEYTVRDKKSGKVYFATKDADEAYAELNRLNNGGSRGPELHQHFGI